MYSNSNGSIFKVFSLKDSSVGSPVHAHIFRDLSVQKVGHLIQISLKMQHKDNKENFPLYLLRDLWVDFQNLSIED